MKNRYFLFALSCLSAFCSCSDDQVFVPEYTARLAPDLTMSATVNVATTHQIIDGFASSDAWTMDYVGRYWDSSTKEDMARLLFSQNMKDGSPEGIGLSMWRVNVGGGSAEQGTASGIEDKTRRVECFLTQSGTYDWSKQRGQQYFMQKAKEYGCNQFVLFSNTPPVQYTVNGKGCGAGWDNNLKNEYFDDFADFLATVAQHFEEQGYNIPYISPVNEPQYSWGGGQEGCSWQNTHIVKLAKELDKSLTAKGLDNTMMLLAEAAKWNFLYNSESSWADRAFVIDHFFNQSYDGGKNYIGDLKHMPKLVCGHSYWLDKSWNTLLDTRTKVREKAEAFGLKVYQTEWSMLDNSSKGEYEDCPIYDEASYMDLALVMSKVMHHDLVTANVSSWAYWTTASPEVYSQKSRFYLIRLIPQGNDYGDIAQGGTFTDSKNLWVLGNYSLFIRPGYKRVDLDIPESSRKFFGSAYISPQQDKLVVVYTNINEQSIEIETGIEGLNGKKVVASKQYVTSKTSNLREVDEYLKDYIPAKSVVTVVYDLE